MNAEVPANILDDLHPIDETGPIIDVLLLDNGQIVALFGHWITLLTPNGKVLTPICGIERCTSLGKFAHGFVVTCVSKLLLFFKIENNELTMPFRLYTDNQVTGACSLDTNSLWLVAEDEPMIYLLDRGICIKAINMDSYGRDLPHRKSSRRVRQNHIGNLVVSDEKNDLVFVLSKHLELIASYDVNMPSDIATSENSVFVSQKGIENCVTKIDLAGLSKTVLFKGEGIEMPNCVSVNKNNAIMIGMQTNQPVARKYDLEKK